jgi:hypothetical protein
MKIRWKYLSWFHETSEVLQNCGFCAGLFPDETHDGSVNIEEIDECIWECLDEVFDTSHSIN